jgi:hypothetical protein
VASRVVEQRNLLGRQRRQLAFDALLPARRQLLLKRLHLPILVHLLPLSQLVHFCLMRV